MERGLYVGVCGLDRENVVTLGIQVHGTGEGCGYYGEGTTGVAVLLMRGVATYGSGRGLQPTGVLPVSHAWSKGGVWLPVSHGYRERSTTMLASTMMPRAVAPTPCAAT